MQSIYPRVRAFGWGIESVFSKTTFVTGGQTLTDFDAHTDDLGEPAEEVSERGGKLVAVEEPEVVVEPLFDAIVIEGGQSDERLANPSSTNQGDWCEVLWKVYNPDQLVASK